MINDIKSSGAEASFSSKGLGLSKSGRASPAQPVKGPTSLDLFVPLKKPPLLVPSEELSLSSEAKSLAKKAVLEVAKTVSETPKAGASARIKAYGDAQGTLDGPKGSGFDASA